MKKKTERELLLWKICYEAILGLMELEPAVTADLGKDLADLGKDLCSKCANQYLQSQSSRQ